jgi:hypothetical protein
LASHRDKDHQLDKEQSQTMDAVHAHPEPQAVDSKMSGRSHLEPEPADRDESDPVYTKKVKSGANGDPWSDVPGSMSNAHVRKCMHLIRRMMRLRSNPARNRREGVELNALEPNARRGQICNLPRFNPCSFQALDYFRADRSESSIDGSRKV